jgi:hypothetical protein
MLIEDEDEAEAIAVGVRLLARIGDPGLKKAADVKIRHAIRAARKMRITYLDGDGAYSESELVGSAGRHWRPIRWHRGSSARRAFRHGNKWPQCVGPTS